MAKYLIGYAHVAERPLIAIALVTIGCSGAGFELGARSISDAGSDAMVTVDDLDGAGYAAAGGQGFGGTGEAPGSVGALGGQAAVGGSEGVGGAPGSLPLHCSNGTLDVLTESDVDCGADCAPCGPLQLCLTHDDCAEGAPACVDGRCQPLEGCVEAPTYAGCGSEIFPIAVLCVTGLRPSTGYTYVAGGIQVDGVNYGGACASHFPSVGGDCEPAAGECPAGEFTFHCLSDDPPNPGRCSLMVAGVVTFGRLGDQYCCGNEQ